MTHARTPIANTGDAPYAPQPGPTQAGETTMNDYASARMYDPRPDDKAAQLVGGYATQSTDVSDIPELVISVKKLDEAIERASCIRNDLRDLDARLFGERPPTAGSDQATPVRSGIVGAIEDRADQLMRQMNELGIAVRSLSRLA